MFKVTCFFTWSWEYLELVPSVFVSGADILFFTLCDRPINCWDWRAIWNTILPPEIEFLWRPKKDSDAQLPPSPTLPFSSRLPWVCVVSVSYHLFVKARVKFNYPGSLLWFTVWSLLLCSLTSFTSRKEQKILFYLRRRISTSNCKEVNIFLKRFLYQNHHL